MQKEEECGLPLLSFSCVDVVRCLTLVVTSSGGYYIAPSNASQVSRYLPENQEAFAFVDQTVRAYRLALVPFDNDECNVVHQVSFRLGELAELRKVAQRIVEETQIDLSQLDQLDHGNAWSLYFRDPEGNMLELYVETPWQIKHPFAQPFDVMQPDDVIVGTTCERVREAEGIDPWSVAKNTKLADA